MPKVNRQGAKIMEPFLGQISLFGFDFAPRGWARCDGQVLPIDRNTALFAVLGTQFGGDGRTTFALPKMDAVKVGGASVHYYIALQGVFPPRD
jgi:microcystin-dependent protein